MKHCLLLSQITIVWSSTYGVYVAKANLDFQNKLSLMLVTRKIHIVGSQSFTVARYLFRSPCMKSELLFHSSSAHISYLYSGVLTQRRRLFSYRFFTCIYPIPNKSTTSTFHAALSTTTFSSLYLTTIILMPKVTSYWHPSMLKIKLILMMILRGHPTYYQTYPAAIKLKVIQKVH